MKAYVTLATVISAVCLWLSGDVWARGGRGSGGGGLRGGGFRSLGGVSGSGAGVLLNTEGGYRAAGGGVYGGDRNLRPPRSSFGGAIRRTPAMSRPSALPSSLSHPSGSGFASRTAMARPAYGNLPTPGIRAGSGVGRRPSSTAIASLPNAGRAAGGTRAAPGTIPRAGGIPATRQVPNFVNLPTTGSQFAGGMASTRPAGRESALTSTLLAGGSAAAFLNDFPGGGVPGLGRISGPGDIILPAAPRSGGIRQSGSIRPTEGDRAAQGPRADRDRPDTSRPAPPGERPRDSGRRVRPGEGPGEIARPGQPVNRDFVQHLPSRISNRGERQQWRQNQRDVIRERLSEIAGDDWYGDEWWVLNHLRELYSENFNYWQPAEWTSVSEWVDNGWTEPVSYNYGSNVYYQDGSVYYGDSPVATSDEYAAQAEAIATNFPQEVPAADDWMPLGVFAITSDGKPTGADPTFFVQLAVSKQGVLSGTLQNTSTGSVQAIQGMVDKQTQRAAWTAEGKTRPLMETGIANLTQDVAPALVHFADGTTQQWLLVRMDKPSAQQRPAPKNAAAKTQQ